MDKNFRSYADEENVVVQFETLTPPDGAYADTLKLSHVKTATVQSCIITGGYEDCVDMNRGTENVLVEACEVWPRGLYGFTIKGGTTNVTLRNVEFNGHGKNYDIDLGNWSDQSNELTADIILDNVYSSDGTPVRVRVLWAEPPTVIGGNVEVVVYPRWIVKTYRWLRKRKLVP